jgi:hypothetical protein
MLSALALTIFVAVSFGLGMTLGIVLSRHSTTQTRLSAEISLVAERLGGRISMIEKDVEDLKEWRMANRKAGNISPLG